MCFSQPDPPAPAPKPPAAPQPVAKAVKTGTASRKASRRASGTTGPSLLIQRISSALSIPR